MLDAQSGAVLRTTTVGSFPHQLAVDAQTGRVFVSNGRSTIVSMLDSATGSLFGTVAAGTIPGAWRSAPTGGACWWRAAAAQPALTAAAAPPDQAMSVSSMAGFGAYLGSFDAGTGPTAVAIDPQTKHAFVVNAGIISASVPKDFSRLSIRQHHHPGYRKSLSTLASSLQATSDTLRPRQYPTAIASHAGESPDADSAPVAYGLTMLPPRQRQPATPPLPFGIARAVRPRSFSAPADLPIRPIRPIFILA